MLIGRARTPRERINRSLILLKEALLQSSGARACLWGRARERQNESRGAKRSQGVGRHRIYRFRKYWPLRVRSCVYHIKHSWSPFSDRATHSTDRDTAGFSGDTKNTSSCPVDFRCKLCLVLRGRCRCVSINNTQALNLAADTIPP